MKQTLRSFAVGASVNQGKFLAFLLKLRFEDGSEILTAWAKNTIPLLLQIFLENNRGQTTVYGNESKGLFGG